MRGHQFTYIPDEWVNLGVLGEHPIMILAIIDAEENRFGWSYKATIMKATVELSWPGRKQKHVIDVTPALIEKAWKRESWEDKIVREYLALSKRSEDDRFDLEA